MGKASEWKIRMRRKKTVVVRGSSPKEGYHSKKNIAGKRLSLPWKRGKQLRGIKRV